MIDGQNVSPGMRLRCVDNPGLRGKATGRTRSGGSLLMVQIEIGPNDTRFFRESQLEEDTESDQPDQLFRDRAFGRPEDLRRLLALSRMSGELTNVLYSMESSNTEFFAHQYKPVLKFLESPIGRILIADEVGLGKTIEAVFIWQELQARFDARRLLIVCPSMLREKWKGDLLTRFGIEDAQIMDAKGLLEVVERVALGGSSKSFIAITSLEGIRVREEDADPDAFNARERLAGILKSQGEQEGRTLFDLVVIDEAHYLRNSATASHQIATLLRDASRNFVLLSATPLQTKEENLYNLLRLLAPEYFTDQSVFLNMFAKNAILVRAVNAVLYGKDSGQIIDSLRCLSEEPTFRDEPFIHRALNLFCAGEFPSSEDRVQAGRMLDSLSLFGMYYTRTRKRDVFTERVLRDAHTVSVDLSEYELDVYESVSSQIRSRSRETKMVDVFGLISRQRQLASSIYASLKKWVSASDEVEEDLWEDLGAVSEENHHKRLGPSLQTMNLDFDLERLKEQDSKYIGFSKAVRAILDNDQGEKIVVFSYYRATIFYLVQRLLEDGVQAISLVGGMGDERWRVLDRFRDDRSLKVLVSSEVGSEGVDLQFCRYLFNYDLPWNPMRLEQRIGRLDRIGQKAKKIMIYNLYCPNTIEDRVVMRLYERIEIFRNSIGDLEDILGEYIDRITGIILNPDLNSKEREELLLQSEMALIQQRLRNAELEEQSIEMLGHGDKVLTAIERAHGMRRWVGPEDLIALVHDFFSERYPQTMFQRGKADGSLNLCLSREARRSLQRYIEQEKPSISTSLVTYDSTVLCLFEPKSYPGKIRIKSERVSLNHPLIQWILSEYETNRIGLHASSAILLQTESETDMFVYLVQKWSFKGIKIKEEQSFLLCSIITGELLEGEKAEYLIMMAAEKGDPWYSWRSDTRGLDLDSAGLAVLNRAGINYEKTLVQLQDENEAFCSRQQHYVKLSYERRLESELDLIRRLREQGKTRIIPLHEGKLKNLEREREIKLDNVSQKRIIKDQFIDLSMGLLKISERRP